MSDRVLHEWRYPRRTYRLLEPDVGDSVQRIQAEDYKGDSVTLRVSDPDLVNQLLCLRGLLEEALDSVDDPDVEDRIRQALHREEDRT